MKKIFSSIIPAPNPTGNLHVGHLLNLCLQDVFCRWKKYKNHDVYWLAGVDHGATSTQYVVTKEILRNEGEICADEKLRLKINEWIDIYSDIIFNH